MTEFTHLPSVLAVLCGGLAAWICSEILRLLLRGKQGSVWQSLAIVPLLLILPVFSYQWLFPYDGALAGRSWMFAASGALWGTAGYVIASLTGWLVKTGMRRRFFLALACYLLCAMGVISWIYRAIPPVAL